MWIDWLVYTLYITKENEYINIKIKGIRRECKKKVIILIKRQKDKIETIDYWDVTTHLPQHQSYHIFITIITLANNKTKKEKQNREANGSNPEKKTVRNRAEEQKKKKKKKKKKEQDHTLISFHGDCAFLALKKKKTNPLPWQSCSNSSDGDKFFLIFNPTLVNLG